jgi:hypothetical protein
MFDSERVGFGRDLLVVLQADIILCIDILNVTCF